MSQERQTCIFPGCSMGTDGGAYVTSEGLEDQNLMTKDMRLHMLIHMSGVSAKMENKVMKQSIVKVQCLETEWKLLSENSPKKECLENSEDGVEPRRQLINSHPWWQQSEVTQ